MNRITKEEFCQKTKTHEDCWIFHEERMKDNQIPESYGLWEEDGIYYFCNGTDTVWKFRDMKKYGEIWVSHSVLLDWVWSIWSTWTVYD